VPESALKQKNLRLLMALCRRRFG